MLTKWLFIVYALKLIILRENDEKNITLGAACTAWIGNDFGWWS